MRGDEMKIKQPEHGDLEALMDAGDRQTGGFTVASRRARGKRQVSSTDGRKLRGMGRSKQFNTKVTIEDFNDIEEACIAHDLTKAEFSHRAARMFIEHLRSGGQ